MFPAAKSGRLRSRRHSQPRWQSKARLGELRRLFPEVMQKEGSTLTNGALTIVPSASGAAHVITVQATIVSATSEVPGYYNACAWTENRADARAVGHQAAFHLIGPTCASRSWSPKPEKSSSSRTIERLAPWVLTTGRWPQSPSTPQGQCSRPSRTPDCSSGLCIPDAFGRDGRHCYCRTDASRTFSGSGSELLTVRVGSIADVYESVPRPSPSEPQPFPLASS